MFAVSRNALLRAMLIAHHLAAAVVFAANNRHTLFISHIWTAFLIAQGHSSDLLDNDAVLSHQHQSLGALNRNRAWLLLHHHARLHHHHLRCRSLLRRNSLAHGHLRWLVLHHHHLLLLVRLMWLLLIRDRQNRLTHSDVILLVYLLLVCHLNYFVTKFFTNNK